MSLYILDTDMLSLYQHGHAAVRSRLLAHRWAELAVTVISVEEQLSGWYTQLRRAKTPDQLERVYQRLADNVPFLAGFRILSYKKPAIARAQQLRGQKVRLRTMDLRIAAIALENQAVVVTRNVRDFQRVPGLPLEDWSI